MATLRMLIQDLERLDDEFYVSDFLVDAEKTSGLRALFLAWKFSSGPYSQEQLDEAGNPYARRAPNAAFDPGTINVQTGEFREGWMMTGPTIENSINTTIQNDSAVAEELEGGTQFMIERPIDVKIVDGLEEFRTARLKEAFDKLFKRWK